jgi:hypothetical protein
VFTTVFFGLQSLCYSQTNNDFNVSPNIGSLVTIDHTFTGFTKKLPNGRLLHFFRLDPGDNGNHVGNSGGIAKRFSDDNGVTWSMPEIIYKDEYDDRIGTGGILDNGEIIIFFGRYVCTSIWAGTFLDMNYISSTDNGETWSGRNFQENSTKSVYMYDIFKIAGKTGYFAASYGNYYVDIRYSADGHNWDSVYTKWDYRSTFQLNICEPIFSVLGNGKIVGLFRNDKIGIYQTISGDDGKTWTELVPTNLANGYFCSYPFQMYDSKLNKILTIVCDRRGADYDMNNFNSGVWIYSNDPDQVFNDPQSYGNCRFVPRGDPNLFRFLGYPYASKTNDSTYLVLYSDSYKKMNNLEDADFYQFNINIDKNVYQMSQTISFDSIHSIPFGDSTVTIKALASSLLPVTYTSSNDNIVRIDSGKIIPVGVGTCIITALQNGAALFKAATPVSQSITITKASQTVNFDSPPVVKYGHNDIDVFANTSSNLPYTIKSSDTTIAKIVNGKIQIEGVGTCFITIQQNGNEFYNPATSISKTLVVDKEDQTIDFQLPNFVNANQTAFPLHEQSSSNLEVDISISDSSIAKFENGFLEIVGAGVCVITATQPGNAIFNEAQPVNKTLIVNKLYQTVDFQIPPIVYTNQVDININASATSNLPITITSSDTTVALFKEGVLKIMGAGICYITANQEGNSLYFPSLSVNKTLVVSKIDQTIDFQIPAMVFVSQSNIDLHTFSSSLLPVDITSSDTNVAIFRNGLLQIKQAGVCVISAIQQGDSIFNAAITINKTLVVNKMDQTIDFKLPQSVFADQKTIDIQANATSLLPLDIESSDSSVAVFENGLLTVKRAGVCIITVQQNGNDQYNPALAIHKTLVVNKYNQTIDLQLPIQVKADQNEVLFTTYSSSNLPVELSSSDSTIIIVKNGTLKIVGTGNCMITAQQIGNEIFNAALSVSKNVKVEKLDQTVDFQLPVTVYVGDSNIIINALASSQLPVDIIISDTSIIKLYSNELKIKATGVCMVTVQQLGNTVYNQASTISKTITVLKRNQFIDSQMPQYAIYGDANIPLQTVANSGLTIEYTSSDTSIASIEQGQLNVKNVGFCTIIASQPGNYMFNASASVTSVFEVKKASQTIQFTTKPFAIYTDSDIILNATASSGLEVGFNSSDTSVAIIIGNKIHIVRVGNCSIIATQSGNNSFNAAPSIALPFEVKKANQTVTFDDLTTILYSDTIIIPIAKSSSALPIKYTSSDTSVALIRNDSIIIKSAGTSIITTSQQGNAFYNPSNEVSHVLQINKANQTVTFNDLATILYSDTIIKPKAKSSSTLQISYTSSDTSVALIRNDSIIIKSAGTSIITASQAGNSFYSPSNDVSHVLRVNKANQTISFDAFQDIQLSHVAFELEATTTSDLEITFTSSDTSIAKVVNGKVDVKRVGSCVIIANQPGNKNYYPASQVVQLLNVIQDSIYNSSNRVVESNISLYPNPTKSSIVITNTTDATVTLFAIDGTIVYSINTADSQTQIEVAKFASGVYIAQIVKGNISTNILFYKE